MRFSKLRLLGFKSFVDPTELVIADGLTGVVGPNGCGKSNLLEALRWVMGENRPKAMRGSGMEDVIFNGASSRPARNYAEVTLSLDNEERLAPPAFNDADKIDIIRRITRDAGSAYKVLGKDARARDVQMLFADASTGAHSPALVRQGQISELVNAKPKARRRVLEEAAGISGLYQRRHEAELKLNATQTNLTRVDDVLEQLATQLASLERQARQAKRYREIAEQLRRAEGMLLFRRWSEADAAVQAANQALTASTAAAAAAQGEATKSTTARLAAEETVPPLREEETIASAVLQRLVVEREALDDAEARAKEAIEALNARISQLKADNERETALAGDADEMIKQLIWEQGALTKASSSHEADLSTAKEAASLAMVALTDEEAQLDQATEDVARLEARAQAATRRLDDAQAAATRARTDAEKSDAELVNARSELSEAKSGLAGKTTAFEDAQAAAAKAEKTLETAEQTRADAQSTEAEMRAALSESEGAEKALAAETAALEKLVRRKDTEATPILDDIKVDAGYETALGAALADDLKAPIAKETNGGWVALDPYPSTTALPDGATPLSQFVTAPNVLARRLATIGVVDANDGPKLQGKLQPGQRLVSRSGDLWRWDGLMALGADAPSKAALELQQRNRLEALSSELASAQQATAKLAANHAQEKASLDTAVNAERDARTARRAADDAATQALRAVTQAETDASLLEGRIETLDHALDRRREDANAADETCRAAQSEIDGMDDLSEQKNAIEGMKIAVASARATMLEARGTADDMRREEEARIRRDQEITKELSGWKLRQDTAAERLTEFEKRITDSEIELKSAQGRPEEIAERKADLGKEIDKAEARRKAASDALAIGETRLRDAEDEERTAERSAADARETRARAEALGEAAEETLIAATERIKEDLELAPEKLLEALEIDPDEMPSSDKIEIDVARLRRQRDSLGAVNLRAEEDAAEVQTERDELLAEKADLDAAVAKLNDGIESLNSEGRQRLLEAFDEVNKSFSQLFTHLFGGGDAKLVLVESDDPLEAGLEIMCQPPGKKLATLSLLSGGEQTLTALSLIFAVFLANPSPICVLDEVDAPLDDANVTRFCDLLDEMKRKTNTRFLIITHHAVTMSRMDRLFGVTMAEQGVSQLVSVDLQAAEKLVA